MSKTKTFIIIILSIIVKTFIIIILSIIVMCGLIYLFDVEDIDNPNHDVTLNEEIIEIFIIEQVNNYRVSKGIDSLIVEDSLTQSAQIHNDYMTENEWFYHSAGGDYGENIVYVPIYDNVNFCGNTMNDLAMANCMVKNWANSMGHYENMMDSRYTYTGVDVNCTGTYMFDKVCFATQQFR